MVFTSEFCLLLLLLVRIHLIQTYTTFERSTKQNVDADQLKIAIQDLSTEMALVNYNLENINPTPMDVFCEYPSDFHQQSRYDIDLRKDKKVSDSDAEKELKQMKRSIDYATSNNIADLLEAITRQNKRLTENISKLELYLNKIQVSETEDDAMRVHYDKHFTCIKNCNQPATSSKSCSEATAKNSFKDGVYLLDASEKDLKPFYAYCTHEKANDKGWMIIQRREDGSVNFNRNWMDYKQGFGNLYGEYWIGLDRLHDITKNQRHEIWIELKNYNSEKRYAKYSTFSVANEDQGYKLTLEGYSGDAVDSFYSNDLKFSTYDIHNGECFENCAQLRKGGWWYDDSCYWSNLNGAYYSASNKNSGFGINWHAWLGNNYSLKYTHMAIRAI